MITEIKKNNPSANRQGLHRLAGQSTFEYALLISIVAVAIATMYLYTQRAINANVKLIEDQINYEFGYDPND